MKDAGKYVMGIITGASLAVAVGATGVSTQTEEPQFVGLVMYERQRVVGVDQIIVGLKSDGSLWENNYLPEMAVLDRLKQQQWDLRGEEDTEENIERMGKLWKLIEAFHKRQPYAAEKGWWRELGTEYKTRD